MGKVVSDKSGNMTVEFTPNNDREPYQEGAGYYLSVSRGNSYAYGALDIVSAEKIVSDMSDWCKGYREANPEPLTLDSFTDAQLAEELAKRLVQS